MDRRYLALGTFSVVLLGWTLGSCSYSPSVGAQNRIGGAGLGNPSSPDVIQINQSTEREPESQWYCNVERRADPHGACFPSLEACDSTRSFGFGPVGSQVRLRSCRRTRRVECFTEGRPSRRVCYEMPGSCAYFRLQALNHAPKVSASCEVFGVLPALRFFDAGMEDAHRNAD